MKKLYQYFGFSLVEQRGFLVLMGLIILTILFPYFLAFYHQKEEIHHQLITWEEEESPVNISQNYNGIDYSKSVITKTEKSKIVYFKFDPNGMSVEDWRKLGFTDRQIQGIKNYEAKGGKFYKKEDVAKMYSISDADYKRIEEYIVIKPKEQKPTYFKSQPTYEPRVNAYENLIIEVNSADTSELKLLRGIGSVLANRVVKYRNALGGFYDIHQIKEVYGLPEQTFEEILPKLKLSQKVQQIKINEVDAATLARHPYISRKLAQQIVNYREQHGNY